MYRTSAMKLLIVRNRSSVIRFPHFQRLFSSLGSQSFSHHTPYSRHNHQNPSSFESASSSSSSAKTDYEDEQARVLRASLFHVLKLGWTESAMIAGARDAGVSPAIVGSFPRKQASLVEFFIDECLQKLVDTIDSEEGEELKLLIPRDSVLHILSLDSIWESLSFFMDECLQKLVDRIDSGEGEELKLLIPSDRISKLVRIRLEMQAPYIHKWPQALSIQALPTNVPTSFKQRAILVDEIWHAAGDSASDTDWYVKRTILGGIYSTTEIYMLTDRSTDFRDTWAFLDSRVRDAFDLKKTIQEAKYLAEAVGAGMGGSLDGFVKRVFRA